MDNVTVQLNKELCAVHQKHPQCNMKNDGVEIKACCKDFRITLESELRKLITPAVK